MKTKFTKKEKDLLKQLKSKRFELEEKYKKNIAKYIVPIETSLEKIRRRIDDIECD